MADIGEKVTAELENIERVLAAMPAADAIDGMSPLELAGVSALLHNFYNGIENILKQVATSKGLTFPQGPSWHTQLVASCMSAGIISGQTCDRLKKYLGFRHFFSHAYTFDLDVARVLPLLADITDTYAFFKSDISKVLTTR
jgi:uncharacterized protein YutE (UPF0331/DUF86 family)